MNSYCVPFALGKISGKTPDEIARMIRDERDDGGRAVRRVGQRHYLPVLATLGFKITATVRRPGMMIRKWAANRAKWADKSAWLIRKEGHVMVYQDGVIYDNTKPAGMPFDTHPCANSRLTDAWQVAR